MLFAAIAGRCWPRRASPSSGRHAEDAARSTTSPSSRLSSICRRGTPVERTVGCSRPRASTRPGTGVSDYQGYAGTAAPDQLQWPGAPVLSASAARLGDLQVDLSKAALRKRQSHASLAVRPAACGYRARYGRSVKVVEVPPGPPVLAPIVAEVYGPDYAGSQRLAACAPKLRAPSNHDLVDRRYSASSIRARTSPLTAKAPARRLSQAEITQRMRAGVVRRRRNVPARWASSIRCPSGCSCRRATRRNLDRLLRLGVRTASGALVPLSRAGARASERTGRQPIYPQGSAAGTLL